MLKNLKIFVFFAGMIQLSPSAHAADICLAFFDSLPSQSRVQYKSFGHGADSAPDTFAVARTNVLLKAPTPLTPSAGEIPGQFRHRSMLADLGVESAGFVYNHQINYAGFRINGIKTDIDGKPTDFNALQENLFNTLKTRVKTFADYDLATSQYLMLSNDAHTSINLNSTWIKASPIQFLPVEDNGAQNYTISFVNSSFSPTAQSRAPQPGDRIVAINGKTVDEFRKQKSVNGDFVLPQLLLVGKQSSAQNLFGLGSRTAKESRGNLLADLGDSITYTIQPNDGGKPYDVTYSYQSSGIPLLRQPVTPDAIITSPVLQPKVKSADSALPPTISPRSLAKRFNDYFFSKLNSLKSSIAAKLPVRRTMSLPPLMSKTRNPGTFKILKTADKMMRIEVSNIKKDNKLLDVEGSGVQLGMGLQTPFINYEALGKATRIQMPEVAVIPGLRKMFNDDFFYAATYQSEGVRIGVLRIPSYEPTNTDTMLQSLRYFMTRLQAESDVLIIDQTFNPGGLVTFSDLVIRSLVGKFDTTKHLGFAVRPSARFLSEYSSILEEVRANSDGLLEPAEAQDFVRKFTEEYNKIRLAARLNKVDYDGNDIPNTAPAMTSEVLPLSEPITMTVMSDYTRLTTDRIMQKDPQQKLIYAQLTKVLKMDLSLDSPESFYTKKVIFNVNAACFSGGDATPVSFKDYKRGILIGDDTGGAGGTVEGFPQTGWRDIDDKYISSLMLRAGFTTEQLLATGAGRVEQVGAAVDIRMMPTSNDVTSGGADYFKKITRVAVDYAKGVLKQP